MVFFFFLIGLLIMIIAIVFAVKKRNNTKKWIASVTIGVFFSTLFMVIPTVWIKEGQTVDLPILHRILSSLFYSFKVLGGRADISQIESIALSGWLKSLYLAVNYCSFVAAPVLASSLLLSFFGDTLQKIHYWVSFAPTCCVFSELNEKSIALAKSIKKEKGREIVVFCNTKKVDEELVECARKLGGILLYKPCTALRIDYKFKKNKYQFYLIAEDEDKNIQDAETLISKKDKLKNRIVIANVFTQGMTNVEILESMLPTKPFCRIFNTLNETALVYIDKKAYKNDIAVFLNPKADKNLKLQLKKTQSENSVYFCEGELKGKVFCDIDDVKSFKKIDYREYQCVQETEDVANSTVDNPKYKGKAVHIGNGILKKKIAEGWSEERFQMRFIDEIALFCNQQILDHPLYALPNDKKEIKVMIVGCGYWGMHMLKTIVWAGQIQGYSLKIYVYDKDSSEIEGSFYQQCPELKNILEKNTIQFVKVNFMSDDFEDKLKDGLDATYVCVATGDDKLNFTVSEKLYCVFRRDAIKENKPNLYTPKIFTRVRKNTKSGNYSNSSYLRKRGIYLFGTADSFFSKGTLFNTQFEKLAFATHLCYCDALDKEPNNADYQLAKQDFYSNEYNRRSSMATALHFGAKILMCNDATTVAEDPTCCGKVKTDIFSEDSISAYENHLNESKKDELMANEHARWNCFIATEGWQRASVSEMKNYISKTNSHKDALSKSHACLLPYDDLDDLQKGYDECRQLNSEKLKERKFKLEDEKIITSLPTIIRKAKKMYEGERKNVSTETN